MLAFVTLAQGGDSRGRATGGKPFLRPPCSEQIPPFGFPLYEHAPSFVAFIQLVEGEPFSPDDEWFGADRGS